MVDVKMAVTCDVHVQQLKFYW